MTIITSIDATHPVGGDATNGTYGVRQSIVSVKNKINEVITAYNALDVLVAALPPLPNSGAKGLEILDADDDIDVYDSLNFTSLGKIVAKAANAKIVLEQLGFEYGIVGLDRGWIRFGMNNTDSFKLNWFNLSIGGPTSLSYPLAFNTRVFGILGMSNDVPDSSWGKNSSVFTDGMGSLTGVTVDVSRGGVKTVLAFGI